MKKAPPRHAPPRQGTDFRDLVEWAKALGFECEMTKGNHIVFRRPNTAPVFASMTPGCPYARQNTRRDLKRALAEAEQRQHAKD